jgi:hypothetical protein
MKALADLVTRLRDKKYLVNEAEIYFVIPDTADMSHFEITKLSNWEQFVDLFDSWPTNSEGEVKKRLGIAAISV